MANGIQKDLGKVTAYSYAKAAGYTGTEEQFQAIFNEFTENAPGLIDRMDTAVARAEAAVTNIDATVQDAVDDAVDEATASAVATANQAVTDAQAAQTAAEGAVTQANNAVTQANAAVTAAQAAQSAAEDAAESFVLDRTLTDSGAAAPADLVGDLKESIKANVLSAESLINYDDLIFSESLLHGRTIKRDINKCSFAYSSDNSVLRYYTALAGKAGVDYNSNRVNLINNLSLERFTKMSPHTNATLFVKIHVHSHDETTPVKAPQLTWVFLTSVSPLTKGYVTLFNDATTYIDNETTLVFDITNYGDYFCPVIESADSNQEFTIEFSVVESDYAQTINNTKAAENYVIGKNDLYDPENLTYNQYIDDNGVIKAVTNGRYTNNIIPIKSNTVQLVYAGKGTDVNIRTVGYDSNGNFVKRVDLFSTGTNVGIYQRIIGIDSNVKGIRISYSVNADLISIVDGVPVNNLERNRRYSDMKSFGNQPAADGSSGSFCNTLTGTYSELINAVYEPLRTQYPNYISRKVIGRDASDTFDIYAYTFEPRYYQQSILLNAGIHAQEPDSIACLARFCQMVARATSEDQDLYFIRQNVKMTIVPVTNVWGFSQSPHNNNNADGEAIQGFNESTLIAEDQALATLVESLKDELSFIVDMHTTTNDTYLDFYGVINRYCPNVRTLFRVNAWLCDNYAKEGRTVDDQYFGYRESTHTFNAFCWNTHKIPCATLELSDFHWGAKGSSEAITMGITMYANYIIQQINDFYHCIEGIPAEDYRTVQG